MAAPANTPISAAQVGEIVTAAYLLAIRTR
jgi:hypothetical protein